MLIISVSKTERVGDCDVVTPAVSDGRPMQIQALDDGRYLCVVDDVKGLDPALFSVVEKADVKQPESLKSIARWDADDLGVKVIS